MGKYDGGMYETYLFGRTHISGETLTANLTNLDTAGDWRSRWSTGSAPRYDIIPFLNNQNYQIFRTSRSARRQRRALPVRPERRLPAVRGPGAPGLDLPAPRAHRREVPEDVDVRPALPLHLDAGRQLEPDQLDGW